MAIKGNTKRPIRKTGWKEQVGKGGGREQGRKLLLQFWVLLKSFSIITHLNSFCLSTGQMHYMRYMLLVTGPPPTTSRDHIQLHFVDKETEARLDHETCPRAHSYSVLEPCLLSLEFLHLAALPLRFLSHFSISPPPPAFF